MKPWVLIVALLLLYKIVTLIPVEFYIVIGSVVAFIVIRYLYRDYQTYKLASTPIRSSSNAVNIPPQIIPYSTIINVDASEFERVEHGHQYFHKSQNFSPDSPINSSVYQTTLVSGIFFRRSDVRGFFAGLDHRLEFEREPSNKHDKNAIKVIGISSRKRFFIGYVPKDYARQIVDAGLDGIVHPRLRRIFCNSQDFYEVRFEIVGPSKLRKQYQDALNNKPADFYQKTYYKFFKITMPTKLTYSQAKKFISEHEEKMKDERPSELEEYKAYVNIFEEFEHYDFRKAFEIKKPTRKLLIEALDSLVNEGHKYKQLDSDIDFVCDRLRLMNRALDKSKD
jgi:hypothetical protein